MSLFDDEERCRINAFDWHDKDRGFGTIMAAGGFDAVIGNPPWVMAAYYVGSEIDYLKRHYDSAEGKFDLYYLFIELGIRLLSENGRCGMIVPNKFFHTRAAQRLRSHLSAGKLVHSIVDFGYEKIFAGATNYACILSLQKVPSRKIRFARAAADITIAESYDTSWSSLDEKSWHFVEAKRQYLFKKMEAAGCPLQNIVGRFGTGVQTGADRVLCVDELAAKKHKLEHALLRPILRGRDVRRYQLSRKPRSVIFPYLEDKKKFVLYEEKQLRSKYPRTYSYLVDHKDVLSERVWFGKNAKQLSGGWYGMMYVDHPWAFARPHLLTPSLSNRSNFTIGKGLLFATGTAGVTSVVPKDDHQSILYLLGVLNSSLLSFYATNHSPVFQGAYYKFSAPYLKNLPIRVVDVSDRKDKARHDRMVGLVETMLDLYQKLPMARTTHDRNVIERLISATDRQIDQLVYNLYGLTEEEIKVVEEAVGKS